MSHTTSNEYLSLKQAASLCCVSVERFSRWTCSGLIPVFEREGEQMVNFHDLIHHLVRHNIPIPERLLQGKGKKILVIFLHLILSKEESREVIWTLYRLRKKTSCILECITYSPNTELKVITFSPDVILLYGQEGQIENIATIIREKLPSAIPLYSFSEEQATDFASTIRRLGGQDV